MGFLHKLWDETLAGPTPDSGLGKLRKYNSFSAASPQPLDDVNLRDRTITVDRNARCDLNVSVGSLLSPSGSSPPSTPFSPNTPGGDFKKLTRRKSTSGVLQNTGSKTPTGYDWIVLSALDR